MEKSVLKAGEWIEREDCFMVEKKLWQDAKEALDRQTRIKEAIKIEYIGRITTEGEKDMNDILSKLKDSGYLIQRGGYDDEIEQYCNLFRVMEDKEKEE